MIKKQKYTNLFIFFAGLLTAFALMFVFSPNQESRADQYSCIRTDLDAQGMTGNIPDPEFTITYNVPTCYMNNGYTVQRVYMYGNQVAVHYKKSEN